MAARTTDISLDQFLSRIGELYSLPPVVAHFNRLVNDPDATAQQVSDAIATDVAMATKVLRLVNSSFFGFPRRVGNLKTAIVILGFTEIRKLMLTLGAHHAVGAGTAPFPYVEFWRHSAGVGLLAESFLAVAEPREKHDGFVPGLLHDLGKLVIAQEVPAAFVEVRERANGGTPWREAEREILGFDHAELAGALCALWQFPEQIVEPIRLHHAADPQRRRAVVAAIQVGDATARSALGDVLPETPVREANEAAWKALRLTRDDLSPHVERLEAGIAFVEEVLGREPGPDRKRR